MLFYSENIYIEDRAYSWMAEMCLICFIIHYSCVLCEECFTHMIEDVHC